MIRVVIAFLTVVVIFTGAQAAATSAETQEPTAVSADRYIDPNGSNFVTNPNPPPFVVQPNQCTNAATPCLTLAWAAGQADPGDTIIAACGDYVAEETAVLDKNLTVRSENRCAVFSAPGKRVFNISNSSDVTLISLQVSGGDAGSGNGGGIRVRSGSSLFLEDVLVENNKAESGGGILAGGALTLNNSVVRENDAADRGGGIRVGSNGSLTMVDSDVRLNVAGGQGGGIHSSGQAIISENSAVSFNDSLGSGAGIAADGGTLAISDSIINTNFTAITMGPGFINSGGGLHVSGANVTIARSFFTKNKADQGGGIDVSSGDLLIESSTISENVAVRAGGGLANQAETRVRNSTFSGNNAGEGDEPGEGGAFYNWGSSSTLFLTSVTAAFNEAGSGGGLFNASFAKLSVANTIFAQHLFSKDCANIDGGQIFIRSDYLTEDGTCPGALVLPARLEPLADNGGPTETHMPGNLSEAVDIGDPAICAELGNIDQRMYSRVNIDGNGDPSDGNPCDIGAVERNATLLPQSPFSYFLPLVNAPR